MEAPAVTRRRRPFLAPLWLILLAGTIFVTVAWSTYRSAGTTVVVLVPLPDTQPGTIADPPVSADGEVRAQRLARMFGAAAGSGRLDAIYASDDRRAQQTVAPLAERLHLPAVIFSARESGAAAARVRREHAGGTVLVAGGGKSMAQVAQALAGADAAAALAGDPDALYVVSIPSFGHAQFLRVNF